MIISATTVHYKAKERKASSSVYQEEEAGGRAAHFHSCGGLQGGGTGKARRRGNLLDCCGDGLRYLPPKENINRTPPRRALRFDCTWKASHLSCDFLLSTCIRGMFMLFVVGDDDDLKP